MRIYFLKKKQFASNRTLSLNTALPLGSLKDDDAEI